MCFILGRACYFCQNAPNNTACNAQGIQVCPNDADSCENEVRFHGQTYTISKHCKQTLACNNNFIQVKLLFWWHDNVAAVLLFGNRNIV